MAESPFVLIQWGLERCRWSASAEDEFRVLPSFKMSSRCWEIKVIATRRVRKINKDQVIKIGSNFRVKWILWFWHDGGNDLHGFRYEMYFSIWKNWYFWSPRSHHHFIAFDIQYFLFCKKKYCKILGWLIYALYEKRNYFSSSWLLSVEDGWIRVGSWASKRWTIFTSVSFLSTPNNILNVLSNKFYSHWKIKGYKVH